MKHMVLFHDRIECLELDPRAVVHGQAKKIFHGNTNESRRYKPGQEYVSNDRNPSSKRTKNAKV